MPEKDPVIELRNLSVRRSRQTILTDISLAIQRGDFWGVVGPNGAGKSTLLKVIAGNLKPSTGKVISYLHNSANTRYAGRQAFRAGKQIGFLLQQQNFHAEIPFTVKDIINFGCLKTPFAGSAFNRQSNDAENRMREAAQALQIEDLRGRLYRDLSGGEKQKVQLARIYAQKAEMVLLDEPTAGLDLDWQERLTALVEKVHSRFQKTLVMVTHDVDRLPRCCNKVLLLKGGRILADGAPADIFTAGQLSRLYDCRMEVVERDGRFHAFSRGLEN